MDNVLEFKVKNILYCSNSRCDFEFEDNLTNTALHQCPKCGGMRFSNPKNFFRFDFFNNGNSIISTGHGICRFSTQTK